MKLGCHAVLFTDAIEKDTVNTLSSLRAAGAEGAEIGSRFFGLGNEGKLLSALEDTHMKLSGLHVLVSLLTLLDEPQKAEEQFENAAKFLQKIPCKNIITTGGIATDAMNADNLGDDRLTMSENAHTIAQNLNLIAARIKNEYGVQIHYHNHNWEFKNNAVIFNALVDYAPELCFGIDIGWAAVSGYDPITLIRDTCKGRVHYVHLRDYKKKIVAGCKTFGEFQNSYVELGEGDMDYKALLTELSRTLTTEDWIIVEYEKGPVDVKRYEAAIAYVRKIMEETGE